MTRLEKRAQLLSQNVTDLARAQHAVQILLDPDESALTREETRVLVYRLLELEAKGAAHSLLYEAVEDALKPYLEVDEILEAMEVARRDLGDELGVLEGTVSISALTRKAELDS